jgi:hypothetical protein
MSRDPSDCDAMSPLELRYSEEDAIFGLADPEPARKATTQLLQLASHDHEIADELAEEPVGASDQERRQARRQRRQRFGRR